MTHMLYDYGAGDSLQQFFQVQAHALHDHADEMMNSGNALVAEYLQGAAGEAFHNTLLVHTNTAKHIADTIASHSRAVKAGFHDMNATDAGGAQAMSL
jgi:uncharacterized protein YukE